MRFWVGFLCAAIGIGGCTPEPVENFAAIPPGDWALLLLVPHPVTGGQSVLIRESEIEQTVQRVDHREGDPPLLIGLTHDVLPTLHPELALDRLAEVRWSWDQSNIECEGSRVSEESISVSVDERFSIFELNSSTWEFAALTELPPALASGRVVLPLEFGGCLALSREVAPFAALPAGIRQILPVNDGRVVVVFWEGVGLIARGETLDVASKRFFSLPERVIQQGVVACESDDSCRFVGTFDFVETSTRTEAGIISLAIVPDGFELLAETTIDQGISEVSRSPRTGEFVLTSRPSTLLIGPDPHGPLRRRTVPAFAEAAKVLLTESLTLPEVLIYGLAGKVASTDTGDGPFNSELAIEDDIFGTRVETMVEASGFREPAIYAGGRYGELTMRAADGDWSKVEYILPPHAQNCAAVGSAAQTCGLFTSAEWIVSMAPATSRSGHELLVWAPHGCSGLFVFQPQSGCMDVIPILDEDVIKRIGLTAVAAFEGGVLVGGEDGLLVELKL